AEALKAHLRAALPDYMVPDVIAAIEALPETANGKVDRKALAGRKQPTGGEGGEPVVPMAAPTALEARLMALWQEVLEVDAIGRNEGFFEAGGNSVSAVLLAARIGESLARPFGVTELFRHPTVASLAAHLGGADTTTSSAPAVVSSPADAAPDEALAIIGIACRFPGAADHWAFWENLRAGRDAARTFTPEELRAAGVAEELIGDPAYVPVARAIAGKELFDAGFFNLSPRNAALMEPQFRLLLESAWAAIEDAGYTPDAIPDTAVFMSAGGALSQAPLQGREPGPGTSEDYVAWLLAQQGTLATMVSYQLGLRGPSYSVHANCSSSLVALHAAAQALRSGEATHALVGASTLYSDAAIGYRYEPGLNFASDGRCKVFDAAADGMVVGEGAAVLLVKRAGRAIADGDHIYALVKGLALNNDGSGKAGYYAPSVAGQAEVIRRALSQSGIDPAGIGYVEAHGTGTALGDPIEVAALTEAWGGESEQRQYCAIGSVKSNIGHLDTAAGLAGCIKAALSLYHGEIVPSLHYREPNPEIDFEASPFHVAETVEAWPEALQPRRAAVSAFGIGGTNAHAVLEQAPTRPGRTATARDHVIPLSAKRADRLPAYARALADRLGRSPQPALGDLAYTLQTGRQAMAHR
ncbi:MAG: beta-ketoacyl synthase N-terminal-like domain-containing protein, partial [Alphaproteobacteria bacterium]|nr:beta-ketoacyl synthase N-terminal-like domain-containing protein [Alphaproteobacteria bacterium]